MKKQSKITSKGQITVPIEVRRFLRVREGDRLIFESDATGVRVRPVGGGSVFAKYVGIGNPGLASGKTAINRWLREARGHDD